MPAFKPWFTVWSPNFLPSYSASFKIGPVSFCGGCPYLEQVWALFAAIEEVRLGPEISTFQTRWRWTSINANLTIGLLDIITHVWALVYHTAHFVRKVEKLIKFVKPWKWFFGTNPANPRFSYLKPLIFDKIHVFLHICISSNWSVCSAKFDSN